jgi:radical SAM protein with 4Fe4S-binding SPASM domain
MVERVGYARKSKPTAFIDMFTNGVFMTPAKFDAVRNAGISCVNFSLNAVRAEQHEAQMGLKDKFEDVCGHIEYAIGHRGGARVEVRAVCTGWDEFDVIDFYSRWGHRDNGGHGQLIGEGNWAGDNRTVREFKPNEACARALSQVYVTWDGRVTTCCFDPAGTQVFGDLNKQTLREVYGSPEYLTFRETHNDNKADKYAICAKCTRI